jgi:hypothetical protein
MATPLPTRRSRNFQDLTGRAFGKLTVAGYAGRTNRGNSLWECLCECGGQSVVPSSRLTTGKTTSCGCVQRARLELRTKSEQVFHPDGRITLTGGRVCLIDPADIPLVSPFRWGAHKSRNGLYVTRYRPTRVLMHVFLMGAKGVDHINGNGLDNRRSNLRSATPVQNAANKGKSSRSKNMYKGVVPPAGRRRRWSAVIWESKSKSTHLGYFATEEAAARAYDKAAKERHGEFARLNVPEES